MKIMVNAWLERFEPRIQLIETDSGRIAVELPPSITARFMRRGDLVPADTLQPVEALIEQLQLLLMDNHNSRERRLRCQLRVLQFRMRSCSLFGNVSVLPAPFNRMGTTVYV